MAAKDRLGDGSAVVCVVGLGYVGLPLTIGFSGAGIRTIGFDVNKKRVEELSTGKDSDGENDIANCSAEFTNDEKMIKEADFVILCVPTPVTSQNSPDLSYIEGASSLVGRNLKEGAIVILESTVFPGVTEDIMLPILEKESGMKAGEGFSVGYSPERINPGDKERTLKKIVKVVSGYDKETCDVVAKLYNKIIEAGTFEAENIKTAEAAKVIENIQRDLNIALVNELALIFGRMGLDVNKVLEAAETKWNFQSYRPGLVGGHCIPVDPYYLVHKAKELGHEPKVILAGRDINNYMPEHTVNVISSSLNEHKKSMNGSRILLLGLTFKKNVRDSRNSPSGVIVKGLKAQGAEVLAYEPFLKKDVVENVFGARHIESLKDVKGMDCIVLVTDHDNFKSLQLSDIRAFSSENPILVDVRRFFDGSKAKEMGITYKTL